MNIIITILIMIKVNVYRFDHKDNYEASKALETNLRGLPSSEDFSLSQIKHRFLL